MKYVIGTMQNQGWRNGGFEGARTPPRRQKHPVEIKEKLHKTHYNTKIQQKYDDLEGLTQLWKSRRIYPKYMPKCSVGSTDHVCKFLLKKFA